MSFNRLVSAQEVKVCSDITGMTGDKKKPNLSTSEVISARLTHFFLIPCSLVGGILDGLIGVGAGGATLVTGGSIPELNDYAFSHLYAFQEVFTGPYRYFLKTIDPMPKFCFGLPAPTAGGMGFVTDYFIDKLGQSAASHTLSDSLFRQHVLSRLTYGLLAVACVVGRLADAILAIPFTLLSIFTFGRFPIINNIAYRTLQAPNLVGDLFLCAVHLINPFINQVPNIHLQSGMATEGKIS